MKDESFATDNATQEKVEFEVEFQFDHYPYTGPEIVRTAQVLLDASVPRINNIVTNESVTLPIKMQAAGAVDTTHGRTGTETDL